MILLLFGSCLSCGDSASNETLVPAPVYGTQDPAAPGYIVYYKSGVDTKAETARLAAKYSFQPTVYDELGGFYAEFPTTTLEQIRYETSIRDIYYNQAASIN